MVALLWDAGDVVAAIELEESWNELSGEFPFALLCGYHSASVLGDDHAAALREVCRLHSSVLRPAPGRPYPAPAEVSAYFTAQPDAVRAARQFVVDALGRWGHAGWLLEDAELVMSELATNALAHARTTFLGCGHEFSGLWYPPVRSRCEHCHHRRYATVAAGAPRGAGCGSSQR